MVLWGMLSLLVSVNTRWHTWSSIARGEVRIWNGKILTSINSTCKHSIATIYMHIAIATSIVTPYKPTTDQPFTILYGLQFIYNWYHSTFYVIFIRVSVQIYSYLLIVFINMSYLLIFINRSVYIIDHEWHDDG